MLVTMQNSCYKKIAEIDSHIYFVQKCIFKFKSMLKNIRKSWIRWLEWLCGNEFYSVLLVIFNTLIKITDSYQNINSPAVEHLYSCFH